MVWGGGAGLVVPWEHARWMRSRKAAAGLPLFQANDAAAMASYPAELGSCLSPGGRSSRRTPAVTSLVVRNVGQLALGHSSVCMFAFCN